MHPEMSKQWGKDRREPFSLKNNRSIEASAINGAIKGKRLVGEASSMVSLAERGAFGA